MPTERIAVTDSPCLSSLWRRCATLLFVVLVAIAAGSARAQDAAEDVPPRVGRVAVAQGDLYVAPADRAQEWAAIGLNHPVATGDNLWLSGEGRAEVDYGGGQFRLGPDSNLHVSRLDDAEMALFVAQGRVIVRVRALAPGETARIDTPNAQVDLTRPGVYRVDVSPEPRQTWVIVRQGEASVLLPGGGAQPVHAGQTATLAGANSAGVDVQNGVTMDGLDTWSAERDRVYEGGRTTGQYVSPQMVGYADLEAHGTWQPYPDYGAVWYPNNVPQDWAPYRYGHWVWLPPYGWTWVDDAAWGYAPFHYGRWVFAGGRWGWCPGAYVARPVWAPALVAWYGGSGWTYFASFGGPVYGWVPLGWREPYVPWWGRCGGRCYDRYNRPYSVEVRNQRQAPITYANARAPNAITAMPAAAMRETRPVQTTRVNLPSQALVSAPRLSASPDVRPVVTSSRMVQVGRGSPQTAGEIAARVRPQALAPQSPGRGTGVGAVTAVPPASAGVRAVGPSSVPTYDARRSVTAPAIAPQAVTRAPVTSGAPPPVAPAPVTRAPVARAPQPLERVPGERVPMERIPAERAVRPAPQAPGAMPPTRSVPPGQVTAVPPAPVRTVPPAAPVHAVPPAAVRPPQPAPQAREAPAREAPQPRGHENPNAPRQGQN
jgi:hypothetical protein